jgi:hypothetical protein
MTENIWFRQLRKAAVLVRIAKRASALKSAALKAKEM